MLKKITGYRREADNVYIVTRYRLFGFLVFERAIERNLVERHGVPA